MRYLATGNETLFLNLSLEQTRMPIAMDLCALVKEQFLGQRLISKESILSLQASRLHKMLKYFNG